MRNAGDGTPGGSTGRRQRVPAQTGRTGNGGASLFTPAYRVRPEAGSGPASQPRWSEQDRPAASYRQADYDSGPAAPAWADDGLAWPSYADEGRRPGNAIRGFPPAPDEPLPVYPPGPFAAWNRGAGDAAPQERPGRSMRTREDSARMAATITPDEFDTNHSMPAIKDPILGKATVTAERRPQAAAPRAATPTRPAARPPGSRSSAGRGSRGTSRRKRGSRRQPVRLAIGVAVAIIAAVAAILVISSLGKPHANTAGNTRPRTSVSTPGAPAGKWEFIGSRKTDPVPLALKELFPGGFGTHGVYYHVTITREGHDCQAALIGAALQAAVKRAGCSQVLRASYVAHLEKAMATIGVFNLATSAAASSAAQHAGPSEFVAELPTKNGVTSRIGQGSGIEEAVVKGHYLVLAWAEYVDLSTPKTSAQRAHLTAFMNTLIHATINTSLSYRMVDGKPSPSA